MATEIHENLAKVLMLDEKNNEYEILFSEIVGEKCTYKIKEEDIELFGDHASKYMNFFGEIPKY